MKNNATIAKEFNKKALLSTLWVVVMINMLKADILSLYVPGAAEEAAQTAAGTGATIPQLMLGAAAMMELPIAMIVLSRLLPTALNRWANIIVSLVTIAFVIGGGAAYPHYIFIAAVEISVLLAIILIAAKWRQE
jgi:hypothetical protein